MNEDIKKRVGENLRKLRSRKSLKQIFRATGIGDHYLSFLEQGKVNFTIDTLKKLADYHKVDISELFDTKPPVEYKLHIGKEKLIGEHVDNFTPVPLLRDAGSLGTGFEINEKDIEGTALIHSSHLRRGGDYRAIWVKGDSMSPVFNDGEIVAIDVKLKNPKTLKGKFIACHTGDYEVMVKRFWEQKEKYYFEALNKEWERENGPILTPKKNNLILGKVIWAWKKFE